MAYDGPGTHGDSRLHDAPASRGQLSAGCCSLAGRLGTDLVQAGAGPRG